MDRLLNSRQAGFLRNFALARLDPKRQRECAEKAGFSPAYAMVATNRILQRKDVRTALAEAMKRAGITLDYMARKTGALMEAVHPNPKYTHGGVRSADNDVQLRALEFAAHLADLMPSQKIDVTEEHIFLTAEDVGRVHEAGEVIEAEVVGEAVPEPGIAPGADRRSPASPPGCPATTSVGRDGDPDAPLEGEPLLAEGEATRERDDLDAPL